MSINQLLARISVIPPHRQSKVKLLKSRIYKNTTHLEKLATNISAYILHAKLFPCQTSDGTKICLETLYHTPDDAAQVKCFHSLTVKAEKHITLLFV